MDFFTLINNATLLLTLSLLGTHIQFRLVEKEPWRQLIIGVFYGVIAAIAMSIPVQLQPGVIFDGRSVVLSMAGFFTGGLSTAIASLIAIAMRVWLGGSGVFTGVGSIFISAALGMLFRKWARAKEYQPTLLYFLFMGFVVHLVLVGWFFTFPLQTAFAVVQNVALPYLLIFPLTTMLIGSFMQDQVLHNQMEKDLAASERRYRELVETLNEGVWTIDEHMYTSFVNPKMAGMLGYTPQEMIGKPLKDFIHERDLAVVKDFQERRRKGFSDQHEFSYRKKDGSCLPVLIGVTPIFDENERYIGSLAGVQDISLLKETQSKLENQSRHLEEMVEARTRALKEAQSQLIDTEKMATLGKVAGSVGHELRNPLAVISNSAYLLKMALSGADAKVKEYLGIIETETHNAARIINNLLDYSRIQPNLSENVDLTPFVRAYLEKHPLPQNIHLVNEVAEGLPLIRANAGQLEQLLLNVMANAVEAMPDGGELYLSSRQGRNKLTLEINDTGEGIPKENLKKIFEPLFTTKPRGIGLGLAITRRLAELNHIQLRVKSQVGHGTSFSLEFLLISPR